MSLGYGFEAGDFAIFIQFADMIIGALQHDQPVTSRRSRSRSRSKLATEQCREFITMMDDLQNLDFSDVPASLRRILDEAFTGTAADVRLIRAIIQRPQMSMDPSCLSVFSKRPRVYEYSAAHDLATINKYFLTRLHRFKVLLLLEVLARIMCQPMPDLSQDVTELTNLYQNQPTSRADSRFLADWNLLNNANHITRSIYGRLDFRHRREGENVFPPPPANQNGDNSDGNNPLLPHHLHNTGAGNEHRASAEVVWDLDEHFRDLNLNRLLVEAATIYTAAALLGSMNGRMHPTLYNATAHHYMASRAACCIIRYAQVSSRLGVEIGFHEDNEITFLSRQFMKFSELQLSIADLFMTNPLPQHVQARVLDKAQKARDKIRTWRKTVWAKMLKPATPWRMFSPNARETEIKSMKLKMQALNLEFDYMKSMMTTVAPAG